METRAESALQGRVYFTFYRSFYEAVKGLSNDIKLEVLTAIAEYGLYGEIPKDMKPFTKSIFTLIKPTMDISIKRFENGKKGGRGKTSKPTMKSADSAYALTFEEEVDLMRNDKDWRKTICEDFNISAEEYDKRLSRFLDRCNEDKARKGKDRHDCLEDCRNHLRYWMSKAYTHKQTSTPASDDDNIPFPEIGDDFGGVDYEER